MSKPSFHTRLTKTRFNLAALQFRSAALRMSLLTCKFDPNQPRIPAGGPGGGQWGNGASNHSYSEVFTEANLAQTHLIAYPGDFHDVVKEYLVKALRASGHIVVTEVSLTVPGTTPITARLDILTRSPNGTLSGIEVKTGTNPTFTPFQAGVYVHAILGRGVISTDPKIETLGLTPGQYFPPFTITTAYASGPGAKLQLQDIKPEQFFGKSFYF